VNREPEVIVVATRNRGKLREFRDLLARCGFKVIGLEEAALAGECEESGRSFPENARQKAIHYSLQADRAVLADDSGLEVFALGGRPGIYSARYAGIDATDAQRIDKLLGEVGQAGGDRSARFVCALALARQGQILHEAEGECRGVIAGAPRGANGFGYDPVFLFPHLGRTFAELIEEEKNIYSHRARAVAKLIENMRR
jgi:XTP/dITP diphosphohydrolase